MGHFAWQCRSTAQKYVAVDIIEWRREKESSIPGGQPGGIKTDLVLRCLGLLRAGSDAPVSVVCPGALLALFAAVLSSTAAAALSKLTRVLLPFPALPVGTLPNASPSVILAAQVSHNNTGPVLHIGTVVADCKLLHQREDVEVVWQCVLFFSTILLGDQLGLDHMWISPVKQL